MTKPYESRERLIVEGFWKLETPDWIDYFVRCSGRVLKIAPLELQEVLHLPDGAELVEPVARNTLDVLYDIPTQSMYAEIDLIATELGDDVRLFLVNGSLIVYGLESYPQALAEGSPDEFRSRPMLWFFEPEDIKKFDVTGRDGDFDLVKVSLL